jgi:thiamine kinase-like enzyme
MEDLGDQARVLGDCSDSLTYEQLVNLAEAQASLHAWCLTTDTEWRDKFETFEQRMAAFSSFAAMLKDGLLKAKKNWPDTILGKLDNDKLLTLLAPEMSLKLFNVYRTWMPDVLIHGDFWANNIMFEKLPDGSIGSKLVAFIDWQLPTKGNPMMDLGRVLSMSIDYELSQRHIQDIIRKYYDSLIKKLGDRMPKDLTYERVLQMANEQTAMSYLLLLAMLDAMLGLMVPESDPDSKTKREKITKRLISGCEFAATVFDILVTTS